MVAKHYCLVDRDLDRSVQMTLEAAETEELAPVMVATCYCWADQGLDLEVQMALEEM